MDFNGIMSSNQLKCTVSDKNMTFCKRKSILIIKAG